MPKMKSHRGLAKRVKITGTGKVKDLMHTLHTVSTERRRNSVVIWQNQD